MIKQIDRALEQSLSSEGVPADSGHVIKDEKYNVKMIECKNRGILVGGNSMNLSPTQMITFL